MAVGSRGGGSPGAPVAAFLLFLLWPVAMVLAAWLWGSGPMASVLARIGMGGQIVSERVYVGLRRPHAEVVVLEEGATRPLRHVGNHSPSGFEWGYGGSGPADLARSLLADATGDDDLAGWMEQDFKWGVVARLPHDEWELPQADVLVWVERLLAEHPARR
ncbi:protein of unknown function [Candidatus Hydrogenisulfobacillus filiaventi]|uniref:Uncharacterized protein n=1 Tax=Candidatus Hydrogenisulfobacillus filiaventi TaxID=2707344 RepID=A0A6F8ZIA9_9FIRM|nr:protein of unknown function [Candidatus Hydrogenisulfobacillus filiaventi]